MEEVIGSIPIRSTNPFNISLRYLGMALCLTRERSPCKTAAPRVPKIHPRGSPRIEQPIPLYRQKSARFSRALLDSLHNRLTLAR
jgi:hypothetical protein